MGCLAGPAVNVVLAAGLFIVLIVTSSMEPLRNLSVTGGNLLERLMIINIFLAGFNMLRRLSMDGGRVLRALLAMKLEYSRATHDRGFDRTGHGTVVRIGRYFRQSVFAFHCFLCLDRSGTGSEYDKSPSRFRRYSSPQCHDHRFQNASSRR